MPIIGIEIPVDSILDSSVSTKVVKQSGYTGIFFKQVNGIWVVYYSQPSGKVVERDFTTLVPSPSPTVFYNPTVDDNALLDSNGIIVDLYYDDQDSKFKCGRPNDR